MKRYTVSKEIPLKTLVQAYEIWITTNLSQRQIARALQINHRTLSQAIKIAEQRGLYGTYKPQCSRKIVLDFLQRIPDRLTTNQIADKLNLGLDVTKQAVYKLYREKRIKRKQITYNTYEYYYAI